MPDNQPDEKQRRQQENILHNEAAQDRFKVGSRPGYSNQGPHDIDIEDNTAPDGYGLQDQFGDVDGQDPYSNLDEEQPGITLGGTDNSYDPEETLYGLAEPLARPDEKSTKGRDKDKAGTRISQDMTAYQQ